MLGARVEVGVMIGRQFKNLKERMRPESRARIEEKTESLLQAMSSAEPHAGRAAEEPARANVDEAATGGADSETAK